MARTSLKALEIPEGVTLEDNQGVITFTGKLGNMSLEIHKDVDINKDDSTISFSPNKNRMTETRTYFGYIFSLSGLKP